MINDSNNIKELARDDDPTVELEIPIHAQNHDDRSEVEAGTFDADSVDHDGSSGVTVSELRTDLCSRKKTIGQLQYDIEQLRAKWLGLEAEISARESQTQQLNAELMFGAKFPVMFYCQLRHIDLADVQHRTQRHRDHAPHRMRRQPGQGDPVVSVQPLAVGRSGSRVVMDAGAFDVPSIT